MGKDHARAAIAALVVTLGVSVARSGQWTQRGADAGHTSFIDISLDPAVFAHAWTAPMGFPQSGTGSWRERAVACDGERVFRTALEGYAPSGDYHVIALDIHTGAERWRTTLRGRCFDGVSEPSVSDGIVYVNRAGHSGISGGTEADLPKLYGLDAATGEILFYTPYSAQWASNDRPTVSGGQVFAGGGYYGGMYAYNAATGAQQWFASPPDFSTSGGVAADESFVYAFGPGVYSRATGALVDQVAHPAGASLSWPVVSPSGKLLLSYYLGGGRGVAAFDRSGLGHLWDYAAPEQVGVMAVGNGKVAAVSGSNLILLDEETGRELMRWEAGTSLGRELALTRSHAFVQAGSSVHAIDLAGGGSVWSYPLTGEMALSDGYLFLSNHGAVTAFAIPEPAALSLVALGGLALIRRRRKQHALR